MADTRLYSEFADKKNYEQLSTGIIKILWYSLKDFILAMQRTEFLYFIQKWNIKEPPFTNHKLISTNKFFQMPTRISNNLFMVIFLFITAIIVWVIIFYLR
ncbi:MAG: hypothetical protein O4861_20255 [Trichodesmium sp. St16_bin4-tuft]|nr:hypothetical protein [Trichodesmium sp. St16_bin4-tuft]